MSALENSVIANIEVQTVQNVMISRYFTAAGLVVVLYDTILTIEDEVRLVWPGPFKFPKLLYYINRYLTIACLVATNYLLAGFRPPLSNTLCQVWVFVAAIAEMIAVAASSGIIVLRVVALYERAIWVARGLWILSGLLCVITIILASFTIKSVYKDLVYDALSGVCLPVGTTYKSYGMFAIPLAFDVVIIVLTTFKTYQLAASVRRESGSVILHTMLWDGIMYFTVVVALRVFNTLVWAILPNSFIYLAVYLYWVMISTLTSRLSLNLRSAASNRPGDHTRSMTTLPSGDKPQESIQTIGRRKFKATNFDTALFALPERGQSFSQDASEIKENSSGGDIELQLRHSLCSGHSIDVAA